ncbi:DUF485 domain-containing protein [Uruburuella testudinis]|uniref:DUF485 domain-containing protein n=1 Tax=Uruburuella testudinis TaxID=1282863 RepID=A0ABY4DVT8_9NEIS|nr:DUF485 domain-containing protein [Uruburuella testudinis]UOO83148.1 DUF485 domain-containing protein [Uruburuella testudinis]
MDKQTAQKVLSHPKFQKMAAQKAVLGWLFSAVIFTVYVAFILFIGISPQVFATPVAPGSVTTWGIYVGLFVIVFSVVLTGVYVYIANGKFEQATREVVREVMEIEK